MRRSLIAALSLPLLLTYAHAQTPQAAKKKRWLDCDVVWAVTDTQNIGPEFFVKVVFHDAPLVGAKVVLYEIQNKGATYGRVAETRAETNSQGVAEFFGVRQGSYYVGLEGGLLVPETPVHVSKHLSAGAEVQIRWPVEYMASRSLRGRLVEPLSSNLNIRSFAAATIDLLNLRTGELIEKTSVRPDGYYRFSVTEPGFYAFRLTVAGKDRRPTSYSTIVAVDLDPASSDDEMPTMKVSVSKCAGVELSRLPKEERAEQQ